MQIVAVPKSTKIIAVKSGKEGADALTKVLSKPQVNQKNDIIEFIEENLILG